jgi:hypothetical protein
MSSELVAAVFLSFSVVILMPNQRHFSPDLHRRNGGGQIPHAHKVVDLAREGKNPVH